MNRPPRWFLFLAAAAVLAALPRSPRADVPSLGSSGPVAAGAPAAAPAAPAEAKAASDPVGSGFSPSIDDPGRVQLILGIIGTARDGGQFRFPKDGAVWQNREGQLPAEPPGFYREYTLLPPPGSPSSVQVGGQSFDIAPPQGTRGVERLIIGDGKLYYYTPDHYQTFIQLTVLP